jgi:hypothetical protein
MDWWIDPDGYYDDIVKKDESVKNNDIPKTQQLCYHDWKPIVLIISTVYNCSKCGVKKEDYESWRKS